MNSTGGPPPDYRDWPNLVAAILMTINVVLGILFSGAVIFVYKKDIQHRTSFNLICAVRATNNIIVMITTFVLVYIPGSLLSVSPVTTPRKNVSNIFQMTEVSVNRQIIIFQGLFISSEMAGISTFNRFIAIYFPLQYNMFCGHYATIIALSLLYIDRLRNVSFETVLRTQCSQYISFSPDILMFTTIDVNGNGLVIMGLLMFGLALVANILTFVKITLFYLRSNSRDNPENIKNVKKNVKLFFQTVLQDFLFVVDNFFTYIMMLLIPHRFWLFICATFVWQTIHVIDGFVMIMFNDRFSILKNSFTSSNSAPISVVAEASLVKVQPRRSPLPSVS